MIIKDLITLLEKENPATKVFVQFYDKETEQNTKAELRSVQTILTSQEVILSYDFPEHTQALESAKP